MSRHRRPALLEWVDEYPTEYAELAPTAEVSPGRSNLASFAATMRSLPP